MVIYSPLPEDRTGTKPASARTGHDREFHAPHGLFFEALLEAQKGRAAHARGALRRRRLVGKLEPGAAVAPAI